MIESYLHRLKYFVKIWKSGSHGKNWEARQFETQLIREMRIENPIALPGNKGVH